MVLIAVGTIWPVPSAIAMAGSGASLLRASSTPQAAVENLAGEIGRQDWEKAYSSLANKSEFTEPEFVRDLTGNYLQPSNLRDSGQLRPAAAPCFRRRSTDSAQAALVDRGRNFPGHAHVASGSNRWSKWRPLGRFVAHCERASSTAASYSGELSPLGRNLSRPGR